MKKYQLDLNLIASYRKKGKDQMIENYIKSFSILYDLKSYIVYDVKNFPKKTGVYTVILTDNFSELCSDSDIILYNSYLQIEKEEYENCAIGDKIGTLRMLQNGVMYECDVVKNDEYYRKYSSDILEYIDLASIRTTDNEKKISKKELMNIIWLIKRTITDNENLHPEEIKLIHEISQDEFNMIYNAYIYGFSKGKQSIIPKEEKQEEDESFYLEEWF